MSHGPVRVRVQLRAAALAALVAALLAGTMAPATAQGGPVPGRGNAYFYAGPANTTGRTENPPTVFGDDRDEVYLVDTYGLFSSMPDDLLVVRRGNFFIINGGPGYHAVQSFSYGDPGDAVLFGDWDGDGDDTPMVRRGNHFFVRNSLSSGTADYDFYYGDASDTVLVGNWDGHLGTGYTPSDLTDTLAVRRGNQYFIRNTLRSGVADYNVFFGDAADTVLVGDWSFPPPQRNREKDYEVPDAPHGDVADQLAVRRGNTYYDSGELAPAAAASCSCVPTVRSYSFGEATDTPFVARGQYRYQSQDNLGPYTLTVTGDGIGVRRRD